MANKIHLRMSVKGLTVCASRATHGTSGTRVYRNNRATFATIPDHCVVSPEEFRATPAADRCCHCSDRFLQTMNHRRAIAGKPLYVNVWTKETAAETCAA